MEFIDLKAQYQKLKEEIDQNIQKVIDHAHFIMGPEVEEFERELVQYSGRKYAVTCGNGTDALQLAYLAYGIGRGDAVFCPDVTFIASIEPACMLGATPVFCDIQADTYNISPESLERQIKNVLKKGEHRPKAVVSVDFLGNPSAFEEIEGICKKYDLILIEDGAQGFGASYHGKPCLSYGDIGCTSFFPAKPLGCYGDGGAVFTDDAHINELLRSLKVHGKGASKYDNVRVGMNSRLDTLQAAILIPKLHALLEYEMDARQAVAKRYNEAFEGHFITPYVSEGCISNYAQYALLADTTEQRNRSMEALKRAEIPTLVYYPTPQHELKVFEGNPYLEESFENAKRYCATTFSLPMHPYLTQEAQDRVIDAVLSSVEK